MPMPSRTEGTETATIETATVKAEGTETATIGTETRAQSKGTATPKAKKKLVTIVYTCPMHPEVQSDKPGKCKYGMNLKKKQVVSEKAVYTCPMHPKVVSDKPGKCPECGMNLKKKRR
jgi:hypothetical protein